LLAKEFFSRWRSWSTLFGCTDAYNKEAVSVLIVSCLSVDRDDFMLRFILSAFSASEVTINPPKYTGKQSIIKHKHKQAKKKKRESSVGDEQITSWLLPL